MPTKKKISSINTKSKVRMMYLSGEKKKKEVLKKSGEIWVRFNFLRKLNGKLEGPLRESSNTELHAQIRF